MLMHRYCLTEGLCCYTHKCKLLSRPDDYSLLCTWVEQLLSPFALGRGAAAESACTWTWSSC